MRPYSAAGDDNRRWMPLHALPVMPMQVFARSAVGDAHVADGGRSTLEGTPAWRRGRRFADLMFPIVDYICRGISWPFLSRQASRGGAMPATREAHQCAIRSRHEPQLRDHHCALSFQVSIDGRRATRGGRVMLAAVGIAHCLRATMNACVDVLVSSNRGRRAPVEAEGEQ